TWLGGHGGNRMVDPGFRHIARGTFTRRHVHAEPGCSIHLADAAANRAIALGDVLREKIDAADVEPDRAHRALGHLTVVGVNDVSDVGRSAARRQVGSGAQVHGATPLRHRVRGEPGTLEHLVGLGMGPEPRQPLLVPDAGARVLVDDVDELRDGVLAIADHVSRRAPRSCHQLAVHHEQPMVFTLEEALDHHRARVLARHVVAVRHLLLGGEADRDAAAVVAVVGLRHYRKADAPRSPHRLRLALYQVLLWHWQPEAGEDLVCFLLVARQLDGDVWRAAGDGRLDALLVLAVPELHQRLVVEAQPGDAATLCGVHQRRGGRTERPALREAN